MTGTRDLTFVLSFSCCRLFIALQSSLLRIPLLSLCFMYGKLKSVNFGTISNILQVNKNFISSEALSHFRDIFSNSCKVLTENNLLYLLTMSYIMFP